MADDFEFEVEGVRFRVKRTNQCKIIFVGVSPHCRVSDRQKFWIHNGDKWVNTYSDLPPFVRLFVCTCRRCQHPRPDMETLPEDLAKSHEFESYMRSRRRYSTDRVLRDDRRKITTAKETSLDICRRIAVDGYTEEIAYEIMELVKGLPVGEGE